MPLKCDRQSNLTTPHSGYHGNSFDFKYFEGWYLRLTLPKIKETFAFMYSIENPVGGKVNSGGAVQILGINESYLCRTFPNVNNFWASKIDLSFGHWGQHNAIDKPRLLSTEEFNNSIHEGYQVSASLNQGSIYNPKSKNYCRWQYQIKSIYGWGNPFVTQQATAGSLSYLPIFDPGWQITMAHGLATGYIDWNNKTYQFTDVPAYSEKNWGTSFPQKWFWINCNSFEDRTDLAITAGGGIRQILWWQESVGLIGIHNRGKFYEFAPWNSQISWQIKPWGEWKMQAIKNNYIVTLKGTTNLSGSYVRTPTANGLLMNCRDTTKGQLFLELKYKTKIIFQANSNLAGLEIGGSPWDNDWIVNS